MYFNFFTKEHSKVIFEMNQIKNCKVVVKKFPYVEMKRKRLYLDFLKSLLKSYNGSRIYLAATKNEY
jgi:hypothetical protein